MHTLLLGTLIFVAIGIATCLGLGSYVYSQSKTDEDKSDNLSITCVSVTMGVVCTWMMWITTYMHQMNPLINPILEKH